MATPTRLSSLRWGKKLTDQESLKIHKQKNRRTVNGHLNIFRFKDKDTKQFVMVIPSLEISGYGETEKKAQEMLEFCLDDTFKFLVDLPKEKLEKELARLGWKHDPLFNKRYSKAYIDENGDLQNFNAENGIVEKLSLVA